MVSSLLSPHGSSPISTVCSPERELLAQSKAKIVIFQGWPLDKAPLTLVYFFVRNIWALGGVNGSFTVRERVRRTLGWSQRSGVESQRASFLESWSVLWGFVRFWDRVSLCNSGWPGTYVDSAGPRLRDPPTSASGVLGLKSMCYQAWLQLELYSSPI